MSTPIDRSKFPEAALVFEKIVEARRSVRLFEADPVPADVIEHSLDMALAAPNSSNLQPWEVQWVKTREIKAELVKACMSQAAAATAAELIVCIARTDTWRANCADMVEQMIAHEKQGVRVPKAAKHYYESLVPIMYAQGPLNLRGFMRRVLFFFMGLSKPVSRGPLSEGQMRVWAMKSTALACENFMLAISAHGYDTCPMEGFDSCRVNRLLDLPSSASVAMIIAVGKRRPNGVTLPRIRRDRSHFIHIR